MFWKKNNVKRDLSKIPEKLEALDIDSKTAPAIIVKTDLTDDFKFENIWLAVKENILYKYSENTDLMEEFIKFKSGDELFIDVMNTSILIALKRGTENIILCRGSNAVNRTFGEFAEKVNASINSGDNDEFHDKNNIKKGEKNEHSHGMLGHCPKCGRAFNDATMICPYCINKKSVIKRLLSYTFKYKVSLILIIVFMLISAILEVISPYYQGSALFDQVLNTDSPNYGKIFELVGFLVIMQFISTFVTILYGRINSRFANEVIFSMRNDVFSAMQHLSIKYFTDKETGSLMTRVNSDAEEVQWFMLDGVPYLVVNVIKIIGIAVLMLSIQPWLTTVILIPVPFLALFFRRYLPKFQKLHSKIFRKRSDMTSRMNDSFTAMRVVKAFGKEKTENNAFSKLSREFSDVQAVVQKKSGTVFPIVHQLMWLGSLVIYVAGGLLIINGKMGFGILTSFVAYVGMIYGPLEWLANTVQKLASATNSANRIFEIVDAKSVIVEDEDPVEIKNFEGRVTFENVNFSYMPNRPVLKDISFDIKPGEHIGIVGPSGAGKSTLINLIARLYDVDSGKIMFDGVDIRNLSLKWLHDNVGTVLQDTYLFMGTVFDNIAYTRPDATPEEVLDAARMADAHDFIMKMDDGYDTWIGTGGKGLSGGERQRIALARAILKNPKILILDEATSAVDTQTELHIQRALEQLSKGRTTFNIAHRLSTLRNADRLIVIENGNLVEMGTHSEIYALEGVYFKLYQIQKDALKMRGLKEES